MIKSKEDREMDKEGNSRISSMEHKNHSKTIYIRGMKLYDDFFYDMERGHLKAYAAEAAFFLVISLVPSILFLLTLIKYTPVTEADLMLAVLEVFPTDINVLVNSIIGEVYGKANSVIPITAVVAVWSASRGVLSIGSGLNWIYDMDEKRNYIYTRIRATLYTFLFLVAIVLTLTVLVFGNVIGLMIVSYIPLAAHIIQFVINIRVIVTMAVLTFVFMVAYSVLPSGKHRWKQWKREFPGALFAAVGWLGCSLAFSVYVDVYEGFTNMYGSLTTIVLIMLWLYFCMYALLLGARLNMYIEEHFRN